jgi:flagellar basal body-associated protein FliL
MHIDSRDNQLHCVLSRTAAGRLFVAALTVVGAIGLVVVGCSSPPMFEFDELDLVPTQEELAEFSLGEYRIPIPVIEYQADNRPIHRNGFQLEFELFALVSPHEKSQITEAWDRHQGKIRDRVIRICRNTSMDELQEPELATLKGRLLDALAPQLGEKEVRQLLITEIVSQKLLTHTADHEPTDQKAGAH